MALALILAAGSGERFGANHPKALVQLAGRSLLQRSVDLMLAVEGIDQIVVALPPGVPAPLGTVGVEGGAVRSESVARALAAAGAAGEASGDLENADDLVVVHDAARPLASVELVRAALDTLARESSLDAAIAAAPITDTVKRVHDGIVVETLDRSTLWAVQTPQVFRRGALERALDVQPDVLAQATDDAWLVELFGGRVAVVPADRENLKITTPPDLTLAELLIAHRPA